MPIRANGFLNWDALNFYYRQFQNWITLLKCFGTDSEGQHNLVSDDEQLQVHGWKYKY